MLIFPKEILWTHMLFQAKIAPKRHGSRYLQNDPCVHGVAFGKINMAYDGLWGNALS